MKKLLTKIRFYIFIIKVALAYITMLVRWLFTDVATNKAARTVATRRMMRACTNNVSIEGKPDLEASLIVINHSNMMDIIVLETCYDLDICWVGKRELNILWLMSYSGHIAIDRESKSSMLSMIKRAKKAVAKGRPIAIFPEGTRNQYDTLLPFKEGPRILAEILQAKIQPVIITGIKETLSFSNHTLRQNMPINIKFLDSIDVKKTNTNYKTWYQDMHKVMDDVYIEKQKLYK